MIGRLNPENQRGVSLCYQNNAPIFDLRGFFLIMRRRFLLEREGVIWLARQRTLKYLDDVMAYYGSESYQLELYLSFSASVFGLDCVGFTRAPNISTKSCKAKIDRNCVAHYNTLRNHIETLS